MRRCCFYNPRRRPSPLPCGSRRHHQRNQNRSALHGSGSLFCFCSERRGVFSFSFFFSTGLAASRPGAQKSLSIKVHKYLQQLIPTRKTKGPLRARRGGEKEYEWETLVLSTPVKVWASPSAQCQSCEALQTGSTDLLCSACTFQADPQDVPRGVKEQTRYLQDYH